MEGKNKERRSRSMPLSTKILQPFFCQRKSEGRESGSLEGDLWEEWGAEGKEGREGRGITASPPKSSSSPPSSSPQSYKDPYSDTTYSSPNS